MLTEKQFCDRFILELRELGNQVQSLAIDRDLSRKLETEVIANNPRLANSGSTLVAMTRSAYIDAPTMRLWRLFAPEANLSLRRILTQISNYPDLLHDKLTGKGLAGDIAEMDELATVLKENVNPHFPQHERTPADLASVNRQLERALELLVDCVRRYYWIVSDSYIDLDVSYADNPLAVLRSPWVEPR
jgi:hypothetical protein